jgi:hypothetical protein
MRVALSIDEQETLLEILRRRVHNREGSHPEHGSSSRCDMRVSCEVD